MWATFNGNTDCVKQLLTGGADLNALDSNGQNSLTRAVDYGRAKCLKLLLEHGASPDSVLACAVERGRKTIIKLLLDAGATLSSA